MLPCRQCRDRRAAASLTGLLRSPYRSLRTAHTNSRFIVLSRLRAWYGVPAALGSITSRASRRVISVIGLAPHALMNTQISPAPSLSRCAASRPWSRCSSRPRPQSHAGALVARAAAASAALRSSRTAGSWPWSMSASHSRCLCARFLERRGVGAPPRWNPRTCDALGSGCRRSVRTRRKRSARPSVSRCQHQQIPAPRRLAARCHRLHSGRRALAGGNDLSVRSVNIFQASIGLSWATGGLPSLCACLVAHDAP